MANFLRLPAVKARVSLSRATIYLKIQNGTFPAPIKISERASAWIDSEIEDWITAQIEKSRCNGAGA
ncbi:AlpA family transcriptional regulator [Chromatium okenii]|jgi:prophage regulatory protein|uniref:helix-turn-helix transcriptional regulator n=1 Tax=Chromatium okenii TaxID=61644 RepID=UPI0026ED006A|nr:AlpA family transcriptional regulator [Chromatium okenii]MBV5311047.1 AlpA family transcriptional regulator [Chromatium okenii]